MEVIEEKGAMRQWSRRQHREGRTVALVPTMGYLHEGHLSLVRLATTLADVVAVSIYVNPSQFAPHEDLLSYPRDLPRDLALLKVRLEACPRIPFSLPNVLAGPQGTPLLKARHSSRHATPPNSMLPPIYCRPHPVQLEACWASREFPVPDLPVEAVFTPADLYLRPLYAPPDQRHAVAEPPAAAAASPGGTAESAAVASGAASGAVVAGHETWVTVERLQRPLCGGGRPVFFRGVATVVVKLLHIIEPDVAVFGKKDYQQWRLIQRMVRDMNMASFHPHPLPSFPSYPPDCCGDLVPQVRDLDMAVQVVGAPLLREADGLAMSSRNVRLTPQHRQQVRHDLLS
ncbi:unnamed protein product [Closterium sp. Naga37s-1]|nr:unnamed protein product [Closterium sp. Naga37s-1]